MVTFEAWEPSWRKNRERGEGGVYNGGEALSVGVE
jgi:hypothetical protein